MTPDTCLDKMHLQILMSLEFHRKPSIISFQLVQKLKQRTFLENFITVLILNMSQHLEKLEVFNLRIPEDISECISESSLNFKKRLKGKSVNLFKAPSIKMRKILYLKLSDKLLISLRQK